MYDNIIPTANVHPMFDETVERATKLFLDGWVVVLGLSGKDSGAASIGVLCINAILFA